MTGRIRFAAVSLALVLVVLGVAPVSAAEPAALADPVEPTTAIRTPLDAETCRFIIHLLRTEARELSASDKAAFEVADEDGCFAISTEEWLPNRSSQAGFGTLATTCGVRQGNMSIYSGPVETYTARHAAYLCWNGTKVWYTSGNYMNCWVTSVPGLEGGSNWCGVLAGNNTSTITLRNDFWIGSQITPWIKRYGYQNTRVNRSGVVLSSSGFCCN